MVAISILFSSRNGATVLKRSLTSLCSVSSPPGGFEVIAVNNASTDDTGDVLRSFVGPLPLTVMYEERPGKNRALNRALEHARGDLIVFTDDDVVPEPDWLLRFSASVDKNPEYHLFGGTIKPIWPRPPPRWLIESKLPLGLLYAVNSTPHGPTQAHLIWGPNMAVRADVFSAGWRFAEDIGPSDQPKYAMGSEVELNTRLEAAGYRSYFVADAVVSHIIKDGQLERPWIMSRAFRHGRGYCRYQPLPRELSGSVVLMLPLPLLTRLTIYAALPLFAHLAPHSPRLLRREFRFHWLRGIAHHLISARSMM